MKYHRIWGLTELPGFYIILSEVITMKKIKVNEHNLPACKLEVFWDTSFGFLHVATFYGWNTFYVFCESLFPVDVNLMSFVDDK